MSKKDVLERKDVEDIVSRFYAAMLGDPIIGYIFTDVVKIDLEHHLPIIVDFWADALFSENRYVGNPLRKHLDLHERIPLTPGHFTRWLYLFARAVDERHNGENAQAMKHRAEMVAKSISASITARKRGDMELVLPREGAPEPDV